MNAEKDYYRILQIDPAAEQEVVQAAYRRLAQKYHPDTNKSEDSNQRMQEINEAYSILGDPAQRTTYDQTRRRSIDLEADGWNTYASGAAGRQSSAGKEFLRNHQVNLEHRIKSLQNYIAAIGQELILTQKRKFKPSPVIVIALLISSLVFVRGVVSTEYSYIDIPGSIFFALFCLYLLYVSYQNFSKKEIYRQRRHNFLDQQRLRCQQEINVFSIELNEVKRILES